MKSTPGSGRLLGKTLMDLSEKRSVLVTCARGLATYLQEELESLHCEVVSTHETGVIIQATWPEACRLNLYLRTAFNVLWLLGEFRCTTADDLYHHVSEIAWEDLIVP